MNEVKQHTSIKSESKDDLEVFRNVFTAIVPIRANSKGLPGKNVRLLAGRPLFEYAIMQAQPFAGRCLVSTDIKELQNAPQRDDCEIVTRDEALAQDDTPIEQVLVDLCDRQNLIGPLLLLQATSPLRALEDIEAACQRYMLGDVDMVMSVTDIGSESLKYGFLDEEGNFRPVSDPKFCFANRQSLPSLYRPNGAIYIFDSTMLRKNRSLVCEKIGAILMPPERSLDIDRKEDFILAERIISGRSDQQKPKNNASTYGMDGA